MPTISKKPKDLFICSNCQHQTNQWYGKCPNCNEWNTLEKQASSQVLNTGSFDNSFKLEIKNLGSLYKTKSAVESRFEFSNRYLNDFWGGGIAQSSVTLLAGEPGLGKSTLALQILRGLKDSNDKTLLYISGEEEDGQIAARAKRLGTGENVNILTTNNLEAAQKVILSNKFDLIVLDSIQTFRSNTITNAAGSITQVLTVMDTLINSAKATKTSLIIIGHVTKEGQVAGPKTLEHLVDSVLLLESSKQDGYRTLSFSKNRYGNTEDMLLMQMGNTGLEIITNPSLVLLENLESGSGVCYSMLLEKNLPLVIEVQALVSSNREGNWFGKRESIGYTNSKLNTIIAILEKYLGMDLKARDIYIQLTGQVKSGSYSNLDLAVCLAILSSIKNQSVSQMLASEPKSLYLGRLTLSGNLRAPTKLKDAQKIANKLGFKINPGIDFGELNQMIQKFM